MAALNWRADEVKREISAALKETLVDLLLEAEVEAKKELYPGHGYLTGTLQKSIHGAAHDYNWRQDDVEPSPGAPERGGKRFEAKIDGNRVRGALGSGLKYAIYPHQGTRRMKRPGYKYIFIGFDRAQRRYLPGIMRERFGR